MKNVSILATVLSMLIVRQEITEESVFVSLDTLETPMELHVLQYLHHQMIDVKKTETVQVNKHALTENVSIHVRLFSLVPIMQSVKFTALCLSEL